MGNGWEAVGKRSGGLPEDFGLIDGLKESQNSHLPGVQNPV